MGTASDGIGTGTIGIGWSGRLPRPDRKDSTWPVDSTGRAHWEGDLTSGSGTATLDTGAVGPMQVTWKARSEEHAGVTSPEELIAAAHAACFSMAFSARLGKAGGTSIVLDTEATATFVPGEGITGIVLSVKGSADGVSEEDFMSHGGGCQGELPGLAGADQAACRYPSTPPRPERRVSEGRTGRSLPRDRPDAKPL